MINAALVGLGKWGQRLVTSVQGKSKDIKFVAGVSRDPSRSKAFGDAQGLKLTDSFGEVLADKSIDAVVLATPHSQHHGEIVAAAKAGKHVFVEKPMALSRKHAADAVKACESAGVVLGIGFGRRFAPAFLDLQNAVKEGKIGDILHVEAQFSGPTGYQLTPDNWRASRIEAPGGGMAARGIHTLDGMIALAGPVASVFAYSFRQKLSVDVDDTTSMLLRFANGKSGYLATIYATANYWRIQAIGTEGWAEMRGELNFSISDLKGNVKTTDHGAKDLEHAILENFARAASTNGKFVVSGEQAVNAIAVLEAIPKSAESGKVVTIA
jgi:predicted dehydrogenase